MSYAPLASAPPPGAGAAPPSQQVMGHPALALLANVPELEVRERVSWLQEVTTFLGAEIEARNRYSVQDRLGNQFFYAIERTDCLRRQLQRTCLHECASWEVDVLHTPAGQYMQSFLTMRRPMQCVCCCLCRPTAEVFDDVTQQKLGSFRDPFRCCNYNFKLRDAFDTEVLEVHGGCCQPAVWCSLPCGPCSELSFDVLDVRTGAKVASIQKQVPSLGRPTFEELSEKLEHLPAGTVKLQYSNTFRYQDNIKKVSTVIYACWAGVMKGGATAGDGPKLVECIVDKYQEHLGAKFHLLISAGDIGPVVGHSKGFALGFLWTWMFASDVDNYKIQFGMIQDPAWKALLLSFTIYMDFLFFNTPNLNNEEAAMNLTETDWGDQVRGQVKSTGVQRGNALPEGWIAQSAAAYGGQMYYVNLLNGKSSWDVP
ncbi:Phospholipid scramblase 1, partial [Symbiodinium microadriaticum]